MKKNTYNGYARHSNRTIRVDIPRNNLLKKNESESVGNEILSAEQIYLSKTIFVLSKAKVSSKVT